MAQSSDLWTLTLACTAFRCLRTPARISFVLKMEGRTGLAELYKGLSVDERARVDDVAGDLHASGIKVVLFGDSSYPSGLAIDNKVTIPVLFALGHTGLLDKPGVGMCGSRAVSALGLKAARSCGEQVSDRRLSVISGYAKGVDTETHLAALDRGGETVIVLAEGIAHFRVKNTFKRSFDLRRVLVLSQFAPMQPWSAHAAMARNAVIYGLGRALVVIEAGERGGTLAAGKGALKAGRPVYVLDFGEDTPPGNQQLLMAGARPIRSVRELGAELDYVLTHPIGYSSESLF